MISVNVHSSVEKYELIYLCQPLFLFIDRLIGLKDFKIPRGQNLIMNFPYYDCMYLPVVTMFKTLDVVYICLMLVLNFPGQLRSNLTVHLDFPHISSYQCLNFDIMPISQQIHINAAIIAIIVYRYALSLTTLNMSQIHLPIYTYTPSLCIIFS